MSGEDKLLLSRFIRTCSQITSKINICLPLIKKKDKKVFKKLRKKTKKIQNFLIKEMKG